MSHITRSFNETIETIAYMLLTVLCLCQATGDTKQRLVNIQRFKTTTVTMSYPLKQLQSR